MKKMREYNVYIDESGDEGIARGSKYFILTAILVKKEKDLEIAKCVDIIKGNLEMDIKSQLHWNKVKGMPNKKMIINEISKQDIIIINIVIDTSAINFIRAKDIYYYFSGYLYERICKIMTQEKSIANINISSRTNLNKKGLINYLQSHNDKHKIDYSKIGDIKIYPNAQKRMLQIADCCCSCLGQALKYDTNITGSLYHPLVKRLYSEKGHFINNGLKFVPPGSKPCDLKFIRKKSVSRIG